MTALLAACRKHLAASGGLHARPETVRLGAPTLARLISALWQSNPPCILRMTADRNYERHPITPAASAALCESVSVIDPRVEGQESKGKSHRGEIEFNVASQTRLRDYGHTKFRYGMQTFQFNVRVPPRGYRSGQALASANNSKSAKRELQWSSPTEV
jgi:hypothetical protein